MNQLRSEWIKLRTTRTTLGLVLGAVALTLLFTLLGGLFTPAGQLAQRSNQFAVLGAHVPAILFTSLVGVLLVTTEYRYGTIRPTLLYEPRRVVVIAAKVATALIGGAVLSALAEVLALAIGALILHERDVPLAYGHVDLAQLALGTVATGALWCALGAGVGAIVRHQVAAIIGVLAWLFVAENLLFGLVPSVGRYGPETAGRAFAGDSGTNLVSPAAGGALLLGWAILLGVAGTLLALRRDVD